MSRTLLGIIHNGLCLTSPVVADTHTQTGARQVACSSFEKPMVRGGCLVWCLSLCFQENDLGIPVFWAGNTERENCCRDIQNSKLCDGYIAMEQ